VFFVGTVLIVVLAAACNKASHGGASTPSTGAQAVSKEFAVVLDDNGLHVPQTRQPSAEYDLSFTDRRSHRAQDENVVLALAPVGPDIVLLNVPAGTHRTHVLLANERVQVVINGVRQRALAETLNIDPSNEYPTPAT
jgi:hypothetical protein